MESWPSAPRLAHRAPHNRIASPHLAAALDLPWLQAAVAAETRAVVAACVRGGCLAHASGSGPRRAGRLAASRSFRRENGRRHRGRRAPHRDVRGPASRFDGAPPPRGRRHTRVAPARSRTFLNSADVSRLARGRMPPSLSVSRKTLQPVSQDVLHHTAGSVYCIKDSGTLIGCGQMSQHMLCPFSARCSSFAFSEERVLCSHCRYPATLSLRRYPSSEG